MLSTLFFLLAEPFLQADEAAYIADWSTLTAGSFVETLPTALASSCKATGAVATPLPDVMLSGGSVDAAEAQLQCGRASTCVVPPGTTLLMTSSFEVAALVVRGQVLWDTSTQAAAEQWLCAGYVAVESTGAFNVSLPSADRRGWVYLQHNGASHPGVGERALGGVEGVLDIAARPLARTWSLLATPAEAGARSIALLHDPVASGWCVGDRIALAPTGVGSAGNAEAFVVSGFASGNVVRLDAPTSQRFDAAAFALDKGGPSSAGGGRLDAVHQGAEVVMLTRNFVITGDDFAHEQPCAEAVAGTSCTKGLHTIMVGGGVLRMQHARVEKCGQRGVKGRYCLHMHVMGRCPRCLLRGNAVEFAQQRGVVVHGTHDAHVLENVFYDVRGAALYIEDGNEVNNTLAHNVAICPWSRLGPKRGCTVPGTDNHESDTSLNQAGLWSLSASNHLVGNRFANSFNGLFIQSGFDGGDGRGAADGTLCPAAQPFGRIEGNTCHGHGRFGFYLLGPNFPRDLSVGSNGEVTDLSTCGGFAADGTDRGVPARVADNVDFGNVFVGQYDVGDVQYSRHVAVRSNNLLYWKTTKDFADGCSAHLSGGYFAGGNVALPDQAAFLIEGSRFEGDTSLEANHHCGVGVTGVLCSPVYVLHNVTWAVTASVGLRWFYFNAASATDAATFVLSPPSAAAGNGGGGAFPDGFVALASRHWTYLLALEGGTTCVASSLLGLGTRYDEGVLCKRPLRSLRLFTRGLSAGTASALSVQLWEGGALASTVLVPLTQIGADGATRKQGCALAQPHSSLEARPPSPPARPSGAAATVPSAAASVPTRAACARAQMRCPSRRSPRASPTSTDSRSPAARRSRPIGCSTSPRRSSPTGGGATRLPSRSSDVIAAGSCTRNTTDGFSGPALPTRTTWQRVCGVAGLAP